MNTSTVLYTFVIIVFGFFGFFQNNLAKRNKMYYNIINVRKNTNNNKKINKIKEFKNSRYIKFYEE